ncbi:hypothetical protein ANN_19887 [Periplaneta americana]|uniref:Reverse transcriptase domain-containing protein n=1 Tax=Periplaneta americana TaxID=6978 RepID=A0ABQ8SBB7_PERAM|nr:hypothetical protein ANN_19887 [Periplaneta americana]
MSPGSSTESYPAFARIGLRKTPEKPQPGNLPRPGFELGPPGFAARRADRYSTDDNASEMSPRSSTESYPAFAHIGLRENPGKNFNQNMGEVIVGGRRIKCIRFANDIALLADEEMVLKDMLLELNDSLEQVDNFKYLACTISSNMSCCQEVKRRTAMAKEAFNRKRSIFCGPVEKELRKKLVKCFVWSVALYGHYDEVKRSE